jgi:ATP synthase protein I
MKEGKNKRSYFIYASLGIDLFVNTFAGAALGYFIDKKLNTFPIFFFVFTILGAISGFWTTYKTLKREEKHDN